MTHNRARAGWRGDRVRGDAAGAKSRKRHVEEGRFHLAGDLVRPGSEIERVHSLRGDRHALERGAERAVGCEDDRQLHGLGARISRRASAARAACGQKQERQAVCRGIHNPSRVHPVIVVRFPASRPSNSPCAVEATGQWPAGPRFLTAARASAIVTNILDGLCGESAPPAAHPDPPEVASRTGEELHEILRGAGVGTRC